MPDKELFERVTAIRLRGWAIAIHNDYQLDGAFHTFWLFTSADGLNHGRYVKGEGKSDTEAITQVEKAIAAALREREPKVIIKAPPEFGELGEADADYDFFAEPATQHTPQPSTEATRVIGVYETDGDYRYLCSSCGASAKPCKHYDVGAKVRESQPAPSTGPACDEPNCGHPKSSHFSAEMGSFCKDCPLNNNQWEHTFKGESHPESGQ